MGTKVRTGKTVEERRAEAERLHEQIGTQLQELTDGEGWAQFLRMATRFHHYSLSNLLLIQVQRPGATRVAGYRQWQQHGRQVKKGEQGIRIFGYSTKRVTPDEDGPEAEERRVALYPVLNVFDIAQTEPMDGVPEAADIAPRLRGGDDAGIFDATTAWLGEQGWTVNREHLNGADGMSIFDGSHRVLIHDRLEPAHEAVTVLHESAHVLLHAQVTDYRQHQGIYETEAESVAYIVAGVLGLDTAANSIGYIAGWTLGDLDTVKATAEHVLATVRTILDGITEDEGEG